jgi:hypothetical protein
MVGLGALGVWIFGPFVLRLLGGLFLLGGVCALAIGAPGIVYLVVGFLTLGAGQLLADFKRGGRPVKTGEGSYGHCDDDPPERIGTLKEPCPETGKVKFATEDDAREEIQRSQRRFDHGGDDRYRLERCYECEFCGWWHTTSQAER